jgi:hypothetical protein
MTFASLRALLSIIGDSLDSIEKVYAQPSAPELVTPSDHLDFPSLDEPYDANSAAEALKSHPAVVDAIKRIVAATGQMVATVQIPAVTVAETAMAVSRLTAPDTGGELTEIDSTRSQHV